MAVVEPVAERLRRAADDVAECITPETTRLFSDWFAARDTVLGPSGSPSASRVGWGMVGMWAVVQLQDRVRSLDLAAAEAAFFGGRPPGLTASLTNGGRDASAMLAGVRIAALHDLLPYAIDPVGPATRRAVLRDPSRAHAQAAKRSTGVFYTPSDLADFMVGQLYGESESTVLDPACGTGVFLDAVMRSRWDTVDNKAELVASIYGLDLDPIAVDAACFTMAARTAPWFATPAHAWHTARLNLAEVDTLSLGAGHPNLAGELAEAAATRTSLRSDLLHGGALPLPLDVARGDWPMTLGSLFPEAWPFKGLVGNPPYAPLGARTDFGQLSKSFNSFRDANVTPATNAFLPFVELMWGAVAPGARSAMVVPLSVAYNTSSPFRGLRRAIRASGGRWTFRFFDRTPDSIFGDDVKQRVAVLLRDATGPSEFNTSNLHRWSSGQRHELFHKLPPTVRLPGLDDAVIPKLGSTDELSLYTTVRSTGRRLGTCLARGDLRADTGWDSSCLGVATTAYNWIPLFRHPTAHPSTALRLLRFSSAEVADWAYAILASDLSYWLWRVEGDGFHVPTAFLVQLPFEWEGGPEDYRLVAQGRELWTNAGLDPVRSVNAGRETFSYRVSDPALQLEVTKTVLSRLGVPERRAVDLRRYIEDLVEAGRGRLAGEES